MKRHQLLLPAVFLSVTCFSQEVISTQGDTYSDGSNIIDYTIGETVIFTGSDGTNDLTQGFHQTNWSFVGFEDLQNDLQVSIFPNPTSDQLTITTSKNENYSYSIFDNSGRLVSDGKLMKEETQIDVSNYATGQYSISILSESGNQLKVFKLIKNQ